jgi:hypothetical protein
VARLRIWQSRMATCGPAERNSLTPGSCMWSSAFLTIPSAWSLGVQTCSCCLCSFRLCATSFAVSACGCCCLFWLCAL